MSEEAQAAQDTISPAALPPAIETTESEQVAETAVHEGEPQKPRADYAPYVDLSDLPEEKKQAIEARFKHISGQTKREIDRATREWQRLAEDQSRKIAELTDGMGQVVDHLQTTSFANTEAAIKEQMKAASSAGDTDKWFDLNTQLLGVIAEKQALAKQPKASKPAVQPQQAQQPIRTDDVVQQAIQNGEMTQDDATFFKAWQQESDGSGGAVRAWANPADPRFRDAFLETQSVFSNQRFAHLPFNKKLEEVDRRMGLQKTTTGQNVLGANLTTPRKNGTIRLTPEQENLAIRMKLGGPKAKSNADHIAKYRQQLETASKKGTRQ